MIETLHQNFPFVSLLIPMRNEAQYILACLNSLARQDYPRERFEVIVLDGRSSDQSKALVETFFQEQPIGKLLDNPKRIQAAAWNLGLQAARGEVIGIVSAHCELAPNYISQLVETLHRTRADMVGGPTHADAQGSKAQAIALALNSPFGVGDAAFHYTTREIEVDTVFMGTCWRRTYEEIGGFDEEMVRNQDDEFSYRLREHGGRIICNPAIRSRYFNRASLGSLWKQYFQYGFYKVRVLQKHPRQMSVRQFVPLALVLGLLGAGLFTLLFPWGWIFLALAVGSYLLTNLAASIYTASKKGWKHLPLLPLCFAILHLSYGLGFLAGLFKFWNRWQDKQGKVPKFVAHRQD